VGFSSAFLFVTLSATYGHQLLMSVSSSEVMKLFVLSASKKQKNNQRNPLSDMDVA